MWQLQSLYKSHYLVSIVLCNLMRVYHDEGWFWSEKVNNTSIYKTNIDVIVVYDKSKVKTSFKNMWVY